MTRKNAVHINNNRTNPINIYAELVKQHNLYGVAFYGEHATRAQNASLNRLWKQALDRACGIVAMDAKGNTRVIDPVWINGGGLIPAYKPESLLKPHEMRLPAIIGVIWHNEDDPTQNEITFDNRRATHFRFNPADDPALLDDYRMEIRDLLFE